MASGYACLYNHSDDPNVVLEYEKEQVLIRVRTLRDITCGEELFKRYACAPWWRP
jgi:SET domain-containing protein